MSAQLKATPKGTFRGAHALWMIVGFFAVTIAVNAVFIVQAVGSFPGEDVRNSYVQGNDYNATLARQGDQARLNWSAEAGLEGAGDDARLVFRLKDAAGRPVTGRFVEVKWRVVGRMRDAASLRLPEVSPGEYANIFPVAGPGRATLTLIVSDAPGARQSFQAEKTLVLP